MLLFLCPHVCFILVLVLISISKIMHLLARNLPRKPNNQMSEEIRQNKGRGLVDRKLLEALPQ